MIIPKEMRRDYLERRRAELELLKASIANPDFVLIKKMGHQIKGNAKSFNFDDLTEIAVSFEKAAESKDKFALLTAVKEFEKCIKLHAQRLASEETVSD